MDPDRALALLAEVAGATDRRLAGLAARIAARLVLDLARAGSGGRRGVGRLVSDRADRAAGDLDLDAAFDTLAAARAERRPPALAELRVRRWHRPATAITLLVDRSGSMGGDRLVTAAVGAAACALRAPIEWAVLAFSNQVVAVKSLDRSRAAVSVVDDLLRLRGRGTTDLAAALEAGRDQLVRASARRRITILLSDCRATAGVDPRGVARRLDELVILAPESDAADAIELATSTGARLGLVSGPGSVPEALARLLA
ncbi:MAG: VWA domain-containing protein [Acidimicrobiales bacterium]